MKTLYIDAKMGAAGDMLTAALLGLIENQDAFIEKMNHIGIPGVTIEKSLKTDKEITGIHISVKINGIEEDSKEHHKHHCDNNVLHNTKEHHHNKNMNTHCEHSHHHDSHNNLHDIKHIVAGLDIPEKVKEDVFNVYNIIADAEAKAHDVPVSQVHFHEVGMMDAVADITAVCLLIHELAPEKIISSPIHVGSGTVICAHGELPVPAPATANILREIPYYSTDIKGELCTPTGAALLKYFVDEFTNLPDFKPTKTSYGIGSKEFSRPNYLTLHLDIHS
ncbi:MAG: LarC family nickel insertion protein [Ruminococcaceae bacterium]|nr:LarC family nickel insertion protein [Oscillospiraceae bacterium]